MSFKNRLKLNADRNAQRTLTGAGGGAHVFDTSVYPLRIEKAYLTETQKGGAMFNIRGKITDEANQEHEFRYSSYMLDADGKNTTTNAKNNTIRLTSGWDLAEQIAFLSGYDDSNLEIDLHVMWDNTVDEPVNIWKDGAEKDVVLPVFKDLEGREVLVALYKEQHNKQVQQNGEYVSTADEIFKNEVVLVFHSDTRGTYTEYQKLDELLQQDPNASPDFLGTQHDKWLGNHKGNVKDRRSFKEGQGRAGAGTTRGGDRRRSAAGSAGFSAEKTEAPAEGGAPAPRRTSRFGSR